MKQLKKYLPIIGLEVHIELKTKSKMFCGCSAEHFLVKANTHTCPVCLGLPGALPVPNQKAIDWCIMIGLALGCTIADESKFDRKNYFYPDLPKGYQISQYDQPFARNGELKVKSQKSKVKIIRINRVHMEEDTGKLIHTTIDGEKTTLIDFNRSGVPLVEIVTEPDFNNAQEAISYLKEIQQIVRYLGVSDCDMEKGSMRCEANVSLAKKPAARHQQPGTRNQRLETGNWQLATGNLPNYKVEVKNINSFRFVGRAINYEIKRQKGLLEKGEAPKQETRGFDVKSGRTYIQRVKEEAQDYRYFPEPDIPPFTNLKIKSQKLKVNLPELPDQKIARFIKKYKISQYNAEILCTDKKTSEYFEEVLLAIKQLNNETIRSQHISNLIVNKKVDINKYLPAELVQMLAKKKAVQAIDEKELDKITKEVLSKNKKAVSDYKKGKQTAITFLIGQVMKETKGKARPSLVEKLIKKELE